MFPDVWENGSDWVRTVAFSFGGKVLASGGDDSRIILWDPKKGERLYVLWDPQKVERLLSPPLSGGEA